MEIQEVLMRIKLFIKRLHLSNSVYQVKFQSDKLIWLPPCMDFVKINCDGSWRSPGSATCVTIICKDHNKLVIASQSVVLYNIMSSLDAE